MTQITDCVLMIRPVAFRMNEQTAVNNYYQKKKVDAETNLLAQREFDALAEVLATAGIRVIVVSDTADTDTPDSIFPNNWISFHKNGAVVLYPMFAPNRRLERRMDILDRLKNEGFQIGELIDYTAYEQAGVFLEGTGSLLLDRVHRKAYCALSPRADKTLVTQFCTDFQMTPVLFHARQNVGGTRKLIYHTNVMMCLGTDFAVIGLDAIDDAGERAQVAAHLEENHKEIIVLTEAQLDCFAGNMLQLQGKDGSYLVMSTRAFQALTPVQIRAIERYTTIIHSPLDTIETCGGGSARCMLAEVFCQQCGFGSIDP